MPNLDDLPEYAAKRIEELLWDGENISVKFDDAASSYKQLARELEEIAHQRGCWIWH